MNKTLIPTMALIWLVSTLGCLAQYDESIVKTNSHWHIDSPRPTNCPVQVMMLNNGKSAWSTNTDEWWRGTWKDDTNGFRTELIGGASWVSVAVGSTMKNSDGCVRTPNGKFARFELLDSNGVALLPKHNAGTNLLGVNYISLLYKTNIPAWAYPSPGTVVADFPETILKDVYPTSGGKWSTANRSLSIEFVSNGPPDRINLINLHDIYTITREGEYMLTVQPVIYSFKIARMIISKDQLNELKKQGVYVVSYEENGVIHATINANSPILYRRDFPSVTIKVHLKKTQ